MADPALQYPVPFLTKAMRVVGAIVIGTVVATAGFLMPQPAALAAGPAKLPRLVLSGPAGTVSSPLMHMVESGALADVADHVEFLPWRDPEQLRVMARDGRADVLAMPTNVAANLYNRGAGVTLLNVSVWGSMWIVTRSPNKKTLADFKGEEIVVPFRGDMPDVMLQLLASRQGLDTRKDFRVRYVPTPMEAMQLLLTRRADNAVLPEPAISMALRKSHSFPVSLVAPELYRGVDFQREWARVFQRAARIPQAGIAAVGEIRKQPQVLARIAAAYAVSLEWCRSHALECGKMTARYNSMIDPEAFVDSIAVSQLKAVSAVDARDELIFFFQQMLQRDPALIGGKLPADDFYGKGLQAIGETH